MYLPLYTVINFKKKHSENTLSENDSRIKNIKNKKKKKKEEGIKDQNKVIENI